MLNFFLHHVKACTYLVRVCQYSKSELKASLYWVTWKVADWIALFYGKANLYSTKYITGFESHVSHSNTVDHPEPERLLSQFI